MSRPGQPLKQLNLGCLVAPAARHAPSWTYQPGCMAWKEDKSLFLCMRAFSALSLKRTLNEKNEENIFMQMTSAEAFKVCIYTTPDRKDLPKLSAMSRSCCLPSDRPISAWDAEPAATSFLQWGSCPHSWKSAASGLHVDETIGIGVSCSNP